MSLIPKNKTVVLMGLIIISIMSGIGLGIDKLSQDNFILVSMAIVTGLFSLLKSED